MPRARRIALCVLRLLPALFLTGCDVIPSAALSKPGRKHPHPCRPSSAPMPTYIGASAEPALSLLYLFLLFFYLPMGYPSRPHPSAR